MFKRILGITLLLILVMIPASTVLATNNSEIGGYVRGDGEALSSARVRITGNNVSGTVTVGNNSYWDFYTNVSECTDVTVRVINLPSGYSGTTSKGPFTICPDEDYSPNVNFDFTSSGGGGGGNNGGGGGGDDDDSSNFSFPVPGGDFSQQHCGVNWQIPSQSPSSYQDVGIGCDSVSSNNGGNIRTQAFCSETGGQSWLTHYVKKGVSEELDQWANNQGLTQYVDDYLDQGSFWYENIRMPWDCREGTTIEIPELPPLHKNCDSFFGLPPDHSVWAIGLNPDGQAWEPDSIFNVGQTTNQGDWSVPSHLRNKGDIGLYFVGFSDPPPIYGASEIQLVVDSHECSVVGAPAPEINDNPEPTRVFQPYDNCDPKALVLRINNGTVPKWGDSDIIMISDPASNNREFTNITHNWNQFFGDRDTVEASPSLAWNACWFAVTVQPAGDNFAFLVWSQFGADPMIVLRNRKRIHAQEVDVGPEPSSFLAFADMDNHLWLTDRYGTFMRDLHAAGNNIEWTADGNISYVDPDGNTHEMNIWGTEVDDIREGVVSTRQHPTNPSIDFGPSAEEPTTLLTFVNDVVEALTLEDVFDIAINPITGLSALLIKADNQVHLTDNWQVNSVGHNISNGLFGVNHDDDTSTYWDIDWRR